MSMMSFDHHELKNVGDALDIAEDATGNFYKFSLGQWKRHRYDVKTLSLLGRNEISKGAFALLNKGSRPINKYDSKTKHRDFYFICLQDHQILKAMNRDKELDLLSLLIYIFTHELIHIVRFSNFFQRFEITGKEKDEEETVVHKTTYEILRNLSIPNLDYILKSYKGYRICERIVS